jgi:diacylglycerol kinase
MTNKLVWGKKFELAAAGIVRSLRTQSSFWVHLPMAAAVLGIAAWLQLETWRWVAILLAIAMVLSAELFNTAIEQLVKVLHPDHDDRIGRALDAAAGAVLVVSIGAAVIGVIVLAMPLWEMLQALLS